MKTILVTGAAGVIGANLVRRICEESPSSTVIGIDSLNDYYDVTLKEYRLKELEKNPSMVYPSIRNIERTATFIGR